MTSSRGGASFKIARQVLPFIFIFLGIVVTWSIVTRNPSDVVPMLIRGSPVVQVAEAVPQTIRLNVDSQGIVAPRAEIELISEVSGRVVHVSSSFVVGAEFKKGELLVEIDPREYELNVIRVRANVAQAHKMLLQEQVEAAQVRKNKNELGQQVVSDFALRKPHLEEAQAKLAAAEAELKGAQLNLERTRLYAPFDGRVREKNADVGQYITQGFGLARLYAVDVAEVRLPLTSDQLQYLDISSLFWGAQQQISGPAVMLTANVAGRHQWEGRIVRMEGILDEKTGMFHAVAQVLNPYIHRSQNVPLMVGLFVEAEINGRTLEDIYVLPRSVIRGSNQVFIVDGDQRLQLRGVGILRIEQNRVLINRGLTPGDRVVVSGDEVLMEGVQVRLATEAVEHIEIK